MKYQHGTKCGIFLYITPALIAARFIALSLYFFYVIRVFLARHIKDWFLIGYERGWTSGVTLCKLQRQILH